MSIDRLTAALGDRYHLERELGQGGMATDPAADELCGVMRWAQGPERRFSDISRAVASATSTR